MASAKLLVVLTACTCVVLFCSASPTRRQFGDEDSGTTSPEPVGMKEGEIWNNDDFVLDADEDWLSPSSPPSLPARDYEGEPEDDDEEYRDAEEDDREGREFLFIPSKDTRLMLQDDEGDAAPIKVRHTSKTSYQESLDSGNSVESSKEDKEDSNDDQFEFTIDKDDDDDKQVDDDDDTDDFMLEDTPQNSLADDSSYKDADDNVSAVPRRQLQEDDDDSDDDDSFVSDNDDSLFDSPEEDSQVIYGDHVFLY